MIIESRKSKKERQEQQGYFPTQTFIQSQSTIQYDRDQTLTGLSGYKAVPFIWNE